MEEKSSDKYQEPIEDEPVALEVEEKVAEKKPEITKEKKVEAEPVEKAEPAEEEPKAEEIIEEEAASAPEQVKQLKDLDRPSQVKALCDLAFQKGLAFAIEVAKTLDNAYVLDEFHDTLVSKLYNELVEKGKLKQM